MARFTYPAGGGGGSASVDIADFIFINEDENNSKVTLPINKEMTIETTRDDDGDADININSADDIFINAYGDDVVITAFNEVRIDSNDGQYEWKFDSDGVILLPKGIYNVSESEDLTVTAASSVVLSGYNGEFLNDASVPTNQIATIGDVDAAVGATLYHGSFYDVQDQTGTANSIQAMKLRQTDFSSGVSIGGANSTQITIANAGIYNIAFSAQFHQTNSSGITNIWLNKNGTPMANTNGKVAITANNPYYVAAWNLFVDADAADYFELMWSSTSNNTVIEYEAETGSGPTLHPAVPSVIVTVNKIS